MWYPLPGITLGYLLQETLSLGYQHALWLSDIIPIDRFRQLIMPTPGEPQIGHTPDLQRAHAMCIHARVVAVGLSETKAKARGAYLHKR